MNSISKCIALPSNGGENSGILMRRWKRYFWNCLQLNSAEFLCSLAFFCSASDFNGRPASAVVQCAKFIRQTVNWNVQCANCKLQTEKCKVQCNCATCPSLSARFILSFRLQVWRLSKVDLQQVILNGSVCSVSVVTVCLMTILLLPNWKSQNRKFAFQHPRTKDRKNDYSTVLADCLNLRLVVWSVMCLNCSSPVT